MLPNSNNWQTCWNYFSVGTFVKEVATFQTSKKTQKTTLTAVAEQKMPKLFCMNGCMAVVI